MSRLFDTIAALSLVGIWPRFIEPYRLRTTTLSWTLPPQWAHLRGLSVVHLSDLHFHPQISLSFLDRIIKKVQACSPDLVLFSGDFLCYSRLNMEDLLASFLNRFDAPLGCYAVLGNHDYATYVSCSTEGVFSALPPKPISMAVRDTCYSLFSTPSKGPCRWSSEVHTIPHHPKLLSLLRSTPFRILDNRTITLSIGLNITGLGEWSLGRCKPKEAFAAYDRSSPGIVLVHHPDAIPSLLTYPGEWIVAGHTHGEQIHFPFWPTLSKQLTRLEHPSLSRGHHLRNNKQLYINRGLGSPKPFRFCSPPELLWIRAT